MEIKSLTSKDICNIIEASARAGVSDLSIGDLSISFSGTQKPVSEGIHSPFLGIEETPPTSGKMEIKEQPNLTKLSPEDRESLRIAAEAQLAFDDPSVFEEYVTDELLYGEVTDEENGRRRLEHPVQG